MDAGKPSESVKRRVAELRSLARRISSGTPESDTGRMRMLLALLFAVGLLGGLRIGESEIWLAPPLATLVLAALALGALNRHGSISFRRLLYSSRSAIDLHGLLVILTIVFASAQAVHVTIPTGSLRLFVYSLFFLPFLALNTRLIAADHARMLWTLVVIFGVAFTVTFVLLPSSPTEGFRSWMCRIFPGCQPRHSATGYHALARGRGSGTGKLHSDNLYQLLAYLRNRQTTRPDGARHEGILLYPQVGGETLRAEVWLEGFRIEARTVDLDQDWRMIHEEMLEAIGMGRLRDQMTSTVYIK